MPLRYALFERERFLRPAGLREGCVFGIPGSDARAFYSPNLVFGIVSGSEKADAAWDFLKTFYDGIRRTAMPGPSRP